MSNEQETDEGKASPSMMTSRASRQSLNCEAQPSLVSNKLSSSVQETTEGKNQPSVRVACTIFTSQKTPLLRQEPTMSTSIQEST